MESNSKAARPYGMAAFEQAREEGNPGKWSEMLASVEQVVRDPNLQRLIANPGVKTADVAEVVIEVCGDSLSETGRNFVRALAEHRRLEIIADIAATYEAERARAEHRSEVEVASAYELSAAEENAITVAMTKRLGTKVDISTTVDPGLIGGVVIRTGDIVIDASIRGRLNQMAQNVA
jgi:F-type H+-transporting ATPase subunit delta